MKMLKVLNFSLIAAIIATIICMKSWSEKNIYVTFNTESAKDINYRVFYTETPDMRFNGKQFVKDKIKAGTNQVRLVLPAEKVARFRLDLGKKPGTVKISNLKIVGDKVVNLDDFKKFAYSHDVEKHQVIENNVLLISSNQSRPFIVYKEKMDINPKIHINFPKLLETSVGIFLICFLLGLFLTRKKAKKPENRKNKQSKE